jgi:threonine dehydrogenase-like Zn-dependent dehydrogenase
MIPSLLAASDVLGTGWFAAVAAAAGPGKTVAVVGDGAVGLMAVLAAKQLGAERIIAMSRHPERQKLARFYGATDIIEERGNEGVAKIKELTNGLGAHSVIEAVGTQESTMQAIGATRPGGHMGYVGVNYDVSIPSIGLFFADPTPPYEVKTGVLYARDSSMTRPFVPRRLQMCGPAREDERAVVAVGEAAPDR